MTKNKKLTSEQIEEVVKLYPLCSSKEIKDATGVSRRSISRIAKKYGLKKEISHKEICAKGWEWMRKNDKRKFNRLKERYTEVCDRIRDNNKIGEIWKGIDKERKAEIVKRRTESLNEIRKSEVLREKLGLKRRTKLIISTATPATIAVRVAKRSLRKRGYICEQIGKDVYYTTETKRTQRESHFVKKYGLIFKPLPVENESKSTKIVVLPDWTDKQGGMNIF